MKTWKYLLIWLAAALSLWAPALGDDVVQSKNGDIRADTLPSDRRSLSFADIGIVKDMLVKPGDVVKAGQIVGRLDSDLDQRQYDALAPEANSTAQIDSATAEAKAREIIRDNLKNAHEKGAANGTELEEAELALIDANLKIAEAQIDHAQKLAELQRQGTKIKKMELDSPIDGIVEKVSIQPGEAAEPNKEDGVLTIDCNQPLWVEMNPPTEVAAKLKLGDTLLASYIGESEQWLPATVIYLSPQADAKSGTRVVRLQLANEEGRPSGLHMYVRIPSASADAGR